MREGPGEGVRWPRAAVTCPEGTELLSTKGTRRCRRQVRGRGTAARPRRLPRFAGRSTTEYMLTEARRGYSLTGVTIPTSDAESFIRGSADAGLLRIVK